jgi:hypothetical protein
MPIQGTATAEAAAAAPDVSLEDSFYSAILQNKSIIDSDFKDMGSLVDLSQTPLIPATYANITTANHLANNPSQVQATQFNPPPPPPLEQPWVRDLIGSIGDISGHEHMDSSSTSTHLGAGYHQCKVARRGKTNSTMFDVSVEKGGVKHTNSPSHLSSFDTQPENGFNSCFIGTRNTEHCKQNITCTFDPRSLTCLTCKTEHPVLESKGGNNTPVTLVLSDQSFPPAVEVGEGGNCLRILRIEDGLLGELVGLALEMFPRGLPENSIVLYGSGSHLLRVGSSGYSRAWVEGSSKLAKLGKAVQVCPLPPILSGPNPGEIFRSIVELRCWVSSVYGTDARGLSEVWDMTLDNIKSNTSTCTPLITPHTYSLIFPADLHSGSLAPLSFVSASSSPASVLGPSCKTVSELLLAISLSLNRDFHANLDPELNLPRDQSTFEQGAKELHFVLLGGSHMKRTAPHLRAMGVKVTDLSVSGWVSNTASGQQLMDRVISTGLPSDAIYVLDLLGNSSARFKQPDDSSSLPVKLNGHWHLLGDLEVMGCSHVESALNPVSHLYKQYIKSNFKIFTPPIPRFVFGSCCADLGHGANIRHQGHREKMLSEHCRVRQTLKGILVGERVHNMRVLDTLGSLTHTNNTSEQLTALEKITSRDQVHLTDEGYKAMAAGILKEAKSLSEPREKGKDKGSIRHQAIHWNGFVSHSGIGKTSLKAAKKSASNPRPTPYLRKNR